MHSINLRLMLCNVMWNGNINKMVTKPSKRLYILRVLKLKSRLVSPVATSSMSNLLWYAQSSSLPVYLSNKIKRVQKRALRILFPIIHYNDSLSLRKSPVLMLDVMICALGCGTASVITQIKSLLHYWLIIS